MKQETMKQGTLLNYTTGAYSDTCYYTCEVIKDLHIDVLREAEVESLKLYKLIHDTEEYTPYYLKDLVLLGVLICKGYLKYAPISQSICNNYDTEVDVYNDSSYEDDNYIDALGIIGRYMKQGESS